MKKICMFLLAIIVLLSLLTGCGKEEATGSTLVYGSGDYDSINPIMNEHCEIKHLLFDSLVKLDKDGDPVASLAESWTYDDANQHQKTRPQIMLMEILEQIKIFMDSHRLPSHKLRL